MRAARALIIDGIEYPSLPEAARMLGSTMQAIWQTIHLARRDEKTAGWIYKGHTLALGKLQKAETAPAMRPLSAIPKPPKPATGPKSAEANPMETRLEVITGRIADLKKGVLDTHDVALRLNRDINELSTEVLSIKNSLKRRKS
jgi:hypothetical protein